MTIFKYSINHFEVRNSNLLNKASGDLSENEKIIRRSVEKVDTWLKDLPPSFTAIPNNTLGDIIRPYLVEKRVWQTAWFYNSATYFFACIIKPLVNRRDATFLLILI